MIRREFLLTLSLLALGTDIVPLDISDSTDEELITKAKKYVDRIEKAMAEGTRNLEALSKKKSFDLVTGKKSQNQISYAAVHLFGVRNSRY